MHKLLISLVALSACSMLMTGCGSSSQVQPQAATNAQAAEPQVDCDAFMQQLAEGCFSVTVFEEDGTTPIHVFDEANNDLGEVDQEWAAAYCECYAQLAFQTFGCSTVLTHEELDDAAYAQTYEPIVASCAEYSMPAEEAADAAQSQEPAQVNDAPEYRERVSDSSAAGDAQAQ